MRASMRGSLVTALDAVGQISGAAAATLVSAAADAIKRRQMNGREQLSILIVNLDRTS
jgi:hypothetical protein